MTGSARSTGTRDGVAAICVVVWGLCAWLSRWFGIWISLGGAAVLLANWPFTLMMIMPVNHQLNGTAPEQAGARSRELIVQWGSLHAVRSALGTIATALFVWALN